MRESVQRSVENIFPSFRLFLLSFARANLPSICSLSLSIYLYLFLSPVPQWKPLELRKIDKSLAAEQFVYSAARLRANELERITYSYGLASSSFLLKSWSSMILFHTPERIPFPWTVQLPLPSTRTCMSIISFHRAAPYSVTRVSNF